MNGKISHENGTPKRNYIARDSYWCRKMIFKWKTVHVGYSPKFCILRSKKQSCAQATRYPLHKFYAKIVFILFFTMEKTMYSFASSAQRAGTVAFPTLTVIDYIQSIWHFIKYSVALTSRAVDGKKYSNCYKLTWMPINNEFYQKTQLDKRVNEVVHAFFKNSWKHFILHEYTLTRAYYFRKIVAAISSLLLI